MYNVTSLKVVVAGGVSSVVGGGRPYCRSRGYWGTSFAFVDPHPAQSWCLYGCARCVSVANAVVAACGSQAVNFLDSHLELPARTVGPQRVRTSVLWAWSKLRTYQGSGQWGAKRRQLETALSG